MRRSGRVRGARATSSGAGAERATAAPSTSGNASPDESWSAEALKNSLFESLRRAGTVEALKAQLRAQVVDKLQGEDASLLTRSRETARGGAHDAEEPEDDLEVHVLQSLVADYLESRGCAYTLSVFMPEDGLGERAPLSRAELCRILSHVEEARPSDDEGSPKRSMPPLLGVLLEDGTRSVLPRRTTSGRGGRGGGGTSHAGETRYKDSGSQTADTERFEGDTAVTVLDRKLSRVNEQYVLQLEREALVPRRSEEERLIRYQRDCDQRAAEHIQSELARFRESELSAMRLQERAAMRRELTRERESARNELQARLAQLAERERALEDSLRRSQAQVEAALYDERQKLLHRFEAADVKTAQERREIGIDRKALKQSQLETDKLKAELERKLLEIHTLELDLKRRHDDDVRTYRQSVLADYEERERRVQREELRVREESAALARAKETHAAQVEAASTVFDDLETARAALELRTQERDDARVKMRALDEQMTFLKEAAQTERERHDRVHAASIELPRELESLRSRMQLVEGSDLVKEKERLVDDLRNQLHELREESSNRINKLETENAALSREKDHLERELHEVLEHAEGHQQQQIADIKDALLEAREEAEAFRVKFEGARAGSRTLETENADLRRLLSQARRALDEEIANPKSYEDPPTPGLPRPSQAPRTPVVPAMPPVAPMAPMHAFTPMQIPFLPYATAASPATSDLAQQLARLQESIAGLQNQPATSRASESARERGGGGGGELKGGERGRASFSSLRTSSEDGVEDNEKASSGNERDVSTSQSGYPAAETPKPKTRTSPSFNTTADERPRPAPVVATPTAMSLSRPSSGSRSARSPQSRQSRAPWSPAGAPKRSPQGRRASPNAALSGQGSSSKAQLSPTRASPRSPLSGSQSAQRLSPPSSRPTSATSADRPAAPLRMADLEEEQEASVERNPSDRNYAETAERSPVTTRSMNAEEKKSPGAGDTKNRAIADATSHKDQAQVVELSEEDAIRAIRETQERQRKLQEEQMRDRQRRAEEAQRRLEEDERRREARKKEAEDAIAAQARAREDAEREAREAEARAKQRENDAIIEQYRQKAKEKLAEQGASRGTANTAMESTTTMPATTTTTTATTSRSSVLGSGASASAGSAAAVSPLSPASEMTSLQEGSDEISAPSQSGLGTGSSSSEGFGF